MHFSLNPPAVVIGFTSGLYTIREDEGSVSTCINIQRNEQLSEGTVAMFNVTASDGSAVGRLSQLYSSCAACSNSYLSIVDFHI